MFMECHCKNGTSNNLHSGIYRSCNTYFANVYRKIIDQAGENIEDGMNIWNQHLKSFGLGNFLGYDLPIGKKGFIAKNPNRATSRSRRFLTAEKQLWGHLNIIKKDGARYFFKDQGYFFRKERIETLIEEFYKNYGKETERVLETTNNNILN